MDGAALKLTMQLEFLPRRRGGEKPFCTTNRGALDALLRTLCHESICNIAWQLELGEKLVV